MTRPAKFKTLVLNDEEAAKARAEDPSNIRQATDDNQKITDGKLDGKDLASGRGYNSFWIDPGNNYANVKGTWRTSWIVDPPERTGAVLRGIVGKLLTSMRGQRGQGRGTGYDNPEERGAGERCIVGAGRWRPADDERALQQQLPDHAVADAVVIVEMVRTRASSASTPQHRSKALNPYLGDSIGWWEGNTLVVETININPNGGGQVQLTGGGKVIERFTRYSDNQILYEFEINDPALYSQVWKGEVGLNRVNQNVYEYACHEGNYGLHGILEGGRANDRSGKGNGEKGDRDEG